MKEVYIMLQKPIIKEKVKYRENTSRTQNTPIKIIYEVSNIKHIQFMSTSLVIKSRRSSA